MVLDFGCVLESLRKFTKYQSLKLTPETDLISLDYSLGIRLLKTPHLFKCAVKVDNHCLKVY